MLLRILALVSVVALVGFPSDYANADGPPFYSCAAYGVKSAGSIEGATDLLFEDRLAAYAVDDFAIQLGLTTTCFGACQCETYNSDGQLRFNNNYGINNDVCPDGYNWTYGGNGCKLVECESPAVWNNQTGVCEIPPAETTPPRSASSPDGSCTQAANPIDYAYGVKVESVTDYSSSSDFPLTVSRYYSSDRVSEDLDENPHWRFTYSGSNVRQLNFPTADASTEVSVLNADRSVIRFVSSDGINYISETDITATLEPLASGWRLTDRHDRVEEFDASGRVTSVRRRNGLGHTYQYSGTSVTITDNFGQSLAVTLDTRGNPSSITLPDGSSIGYAYDTAGILTQVTYADGSQVDYLYEDSQGLLTGIIDERGIRYSTFGFDDNSKAILSVHAGFDRFTFSYNGLTSTVTNPLGKVTDHVFEEIQGGPKLKTADRLDSPYCGPSASSYEYDANGFVASKTDWEGNITAYEKDSRGLSTTTRYALGTAEERVVATQWHSQFRLPEVVTEPGRTTTYTYSPYDNPNYTQRTVTDLATGTSRTWNFSYNQYGQVLTIDGPRSDVLDTVTYEYYSCITGAECGQIKTITNGLSQVTTYNSYNAHGYPLQMTDANGVVTSMTYDQRQRLTSITVDNQTTNITYEPTGDIKRTTLPDGTYTEYVRDDARRLVAVFDGEGNRIDWTLDNAGNRTDEKIKDPNGTIRKSLENKYDELSRMREMVYAHGGITAYEYDNNGNSTKLTDANNQVSTSEYDALDRLIKEIDAISGETIYSYDDRDNLTSVTDPEGLTTTYTYNGFDEVVTESSPDTGITSYTYDAGGNLATETDARGITGTYTYDVLNRLTSISYPDSSENISYSYDQGSNAIGRLSRIDDASGSTEYGYDARGNITSVTQTVNGQSYTQAYSYNGANRLTGMSYPSGRSVSYVYDTSGRVKDITSVGGDEGAETLASTITRLPFGPIEGLTLGNGIQRSRSYDQDYRITNLTDGNVLIKGLGYSPVNNITAITDSVDADLTQLFTYDNLDRLDFATGKYGEDTYTYDGIGNRQSFTRDDQTESYSYGVLSHRLQSVDGQSYQYDAVGNTLNNGTLTFAYNNRNRLTQATKAGVTTDYEHNALGQRVAKSNTTENTHYLYDLEGRLIGEANADSGEIEVEYAYLDGEPLVMWRDAGELPTDPEPPQAPVFISPTGQVTTATPVFEWQRAADEDAVIEYQLLVYDRIERTWQVRARYPIGDVCTGTTCSATPDYSLNFSKNHLWQVRSRNAQGWSEWSERQIFDYLPPAAEAPIVISPTTEITSPNPTFEWQTNGVSITEYQLYVYDRTQRQWVVTERYPVANICTETSCSVTTNYSLNYSKNHLWQVRALNASGWSAWSERQTIDYLPPEAPAPTVIGPTEIVETAAATYEWQLAGEGITEYQLYVYDRIERQWMVKERYPVADICTDSTCGVTPDYSLNYAKNHLWQVRALNASGWSAWSERQVFDFIPPLPDAPTSQGPTGDITTSSPTFTWTASTGTAITEYQLLVYDRVESTWVIRDRYPADSVCVETQCSSTPTLTLNPSANHLWQVRALNAAGWSPWSVRQVFSNAAVGE